ncbi:hypothetical protein OBBRIDRAFT_795910 [Obba rivulosa]|uniref:Hydrophobin n=1 Tax=Obba rivulosa TaxID=1052685 RepID=A0A8E2DI36_9APHY|nr:hypothetical protein OBBRIDRAFT_795910 [Obba rivulosa]
MFAIPSLIILTALAGSAVATPATSDAPTPTTTILPAQCTTNLECCATAVPLADCSSGCAGLLGIILGILGIQTPALDGPYIGVGCQTEEVVLLPILPLPCNGTGLCCEQILDTSDPQVEDVGLGCVPVNLNLLGL